MRTEFQKALQTLLNQHSMEGGSNTPDFILAQYLLNCLNAFNVAVFDRERWHGRPVTPFTPTFTDVEAVPLPVDAEAEKRIEDLIAKQPAKRSAPESLGSPFTVKGSHKLATPEYDNKHDNKRETGDEMSDELKEAACPHGFLNDAECLGCVLDLANERGAQLDALATDRDQWRHVARYFLGDFTDSHTAAESRAEAVRRSREGETK